MYPQEMRRLPLPTRLLLISLLCGALACGGLLYGAYTVARQEALENLNAQQIILARQAAQGIQDYFSNIRNLAWSVAQNTHVVKLDDEGEKYLLTVLRENNHEVLGISRVTAEGVIQFSTPDNSVAGRSIADQEHVARILSSHSPVVSDVVTSTQGYRSVILHVPVFKGEEFRGTLGLLLNFDAIARRYLEGVRVAETGYAFVYSQKGILIYSPVPGIATKHYSEVTKSFPELRAVVERMLAGESGTASFTFDRVRDHAPEVVRKHAAFMPVKLGDTFWSVCVTTPESEILATLERFGLYLLPLGTLVLLFTALGVGLGLQHFVQEKEIVRRRMTEAALRESEERYRSVIENISDVFYRTDALGHLIMVSPSGVALAGYDSEEEILGRPSAAFWRNPAERERLLAELRKSGSVRDFEVELMTKDGKAVHVATSSSFYHDKNGEVLGVEGTFRDITQRKRDQAALEESARRFHSLFDNMAEGVALCTLLRDEKGTIVNYRFEAVNRSYEEIFNIKAEDAVGHTVVEAFSLPEPPFLAEMIDVVEYGHPYRVETMLQPLGKHVALSAVPWVDGGFAAIFEDITQRMRDQAALEESARRFHSLFDNMAEGVALCTLVRDEKGKAVNYRFEAVNRSYEEIFNIKAADALGRLVTEIFSLPEPPYLAELSQVVDTGENAHVESLYQPLGKHLAHSAVPWVDGGFAAIVVDITERKQMESQLRYRALHDPLTGLANRTLCLDRIALANERAQRRPGMRFAVVFMDLDRFKVINDSLGHEAGDMLLREVASRLLACTRRMDTVCRYGGDEFALVLEELTQREVLRTLRRIRQSLKDPMDIGGHSIQVEASFGVAYPPNEPIGPEDILRNANIALHRAKHLGRNRVVVYKQSMHEAAIEVMSMENDIRRGLANGEFYMLYQPTFDLQKRSLRGFEALLRWRHPSRGMVGPTEFIPVAEESGSIFELGSFALDRACREMAEFLRATPEAGPLTLSVNLSPRQFSRQGLAEQIDRTLAASGLPPRCLMLEITESSIMKHPEASANILSRIKARGVGIAIDDFGTGYSSMSALQHLPLNCLKIDRSFVARITESAEDREIVRAIITLAASLHLGTVAEGIETEAQRQTLEDLGCELGQGYLCAEAVPLEDSLRVINQAVCSTPGTPG
ncbi:bifunctional diguanylate cyclase/phosphodiesterase [Humidesulfovibrio idahonensis]